MSSTENPVTLENTFVVLDPRLNATTVAVSDTVYAELDERFAGFKGHVLISSYSFQDNWPTWEVHPHGDELVCLVSGDAELVMRKNGADESVRLSTPGAFVVVPGNTWHTARIHLPATMIFITPGEGTENRELPPG